MKILKYIISSSLLALVLTACDGGGGASGSNSTTPVDTVLQGQFIDAPVMGLRYVTATQSGYTDSNGNFNYKSGEQIEFFLADLSFGKVDSQATITPYALAGDTDIYNPSTKAVNIARILQSLDDTTSNNDLITLPQTLHSMNISDTNLSSALDTPFWDILVKAQVQTTKSYSLKTKDNATNIMINYLVQNNISIVKKEEQLSEKLPATLSELKGNRYYMVMDRVALSDNNISSDLDNPEVQGSMHNTGGILDLAIGGKGFFKLLKPDGEYVYTRNGQFKLSADGEIVHNTGYLLIPNIAIPPIDITFEFSDDGIISMIDLVTGDATMLGQITLTTFSNTFGLAQIEKNIFIPTSLSGDETTETPKENGMGEIVQGMVEGSYPRGIIKATTYFDEDINKRVSTGIFGTTTESFNINGNSGMFPHDVNNENSFNQYTNLNIEIYQVTDEYTELYIKDDNGVLIRKEYLFLDNQKRDIFFDKLKYTSYFKSIKSIERIGEVGGNAQTFDSVTDVKLVDNYAYITSSDNYLAIVNISDKTNPQFISKVETSSQAHNLEIVGNYAYINSNNLTIVDIADKSNPLLVSEFDANFLNVEDNGNYTYAYSNNHPNYIFRIIDTIDKLNPTIVGSLEIDSSIKEVEINENFAYILTWSDNFLIIDISDKTNPAVISTSVISGYLNDIEVFGDYAYINSGYELNIFNISDKKNPVIINKVASENGYNLKISHNHIFINKMSNITIMDITDKENPKLEIIYTATSFADRIIMNVSGDYIYWTDSQNLVIYKINYKDWMN
ncbi:MAG: hypothetical protein U9R39_05210 [Campylobacterota bacterium]|nr:hypothetical protein [Campylobacterota bacterium]